MDTTKRLFNIYTWNMINHEFLLGVGVLSKIQTNPDGCVWTWGIPHFLGLLNYKQVTIHHHLPSITNGFSNQKNNIKKKTPSFTRICWSCYPSKPSIASASLASSLATPVKLRSVASRKSLLLGKCLLYNYHMIVVVYVYIYIQWNYIV